MSGSSWVLPMSPFQLMCGSTDSSCEPLPAPIQVCIDRRVYAEPVRICVFPYKYVRLGVRVCLCVCACVCTITRNEHVVHHNT
jgi:hypothetical protein